MKYLGIIFIVLIVCAFSSRLIEKKENTIASENGFAVVELFTSQGCSSCPAADRLLSQVIAKEGDKVYGLSFHVSYWNYLGWKDPYSQEEFTGRQRQYAQAFDNSNIYTPQMVVNGTKEFVGSDKATAEKTIEQALSNSSQHVIHLGTVKKNDEIEVFFNVEGALEDQLIHLAIVEKDLKNHVPRGENRNRTLYHDNVVRVFKTMPAKKNGMASLSLSIDLNLDKSTLIAYLQHKKTMAITGASRISLAR